jgi:hypothetical protein
MNILKIFAVAIAAVLVLAGMPGASAAGTTAGPDRGPAPGHHFITGDQATKSVQNFMNDPTIVPDYIGLHSLNTGSQYSVHVKNSSFEVNAESGTVESAWFGDNYPIHPRTLINRSEARARAAAYAGQKYDGFSKIRWKMVGEPVNGSEERVPAYTFVFREELSGEPSPVLSQKLVIIHINPETGSVAGYLGHNRDLLVGLDPAVSQADATKAAEDFCQQHYGRVFSFPAGYLSVVMSDQDTEELVWVFNVKDSSLPGSEFTDVILVNAASGEIRKDAYSCWPEYFIERILS